jgi:hypothetical protein
MADLKISALTSAGALAGTEPLPIVQGGTTKKTTAQDIANLKATPNLQQVTTVNSTTSVGITVDNGLGESITIKHDTIDITNILGGVASITSTILATPVAFNLPNKPTSDTFAMLSDVTGGGITKATAAGTDTYTATISGVASYTDGDAYLIRFTNGNTTAATLNINSLGAKTLYRNNDGAIIGGDIWDGGEMLCVYNSTLNGFQCIGTSPNSIFAYVTNDDSVTITKGQVVYAFSGVGDRMTVKLANNTSDATSARTVGVVYSTSIAANQKGIIILQGLLDGLDTLKPSVGSWADGDIVYLSNTAGAITRTKQYAPNHLVSIGIVTTASNGTSGRMYVKIQNGYELDELHNVQAQSPSLKDTLWYDNAVSPPQWKTASIATILGYTPASSNTQTLTCIGLVIAVVNDATNYHIGTIAATPAGTDARRAFKPTANCTVTAASLTLEQVINGSNETVSIYLRNVTDATETLIGTFTSDFGASTTLKTLFSGLSISLVTTKDYTIRFTTPTWVTTNPSQWIPAVTLQMTL